MDSIITLLTADTPQSDEEELQIQWIRNVWKAASMADTEAGEAARAALLENVPPGYEQFVKEEDGHNLDRDFPDGTQLHLEWWAQKTDQGEIDESGTIILRTPAPAVHYTTS